MESVKPFLLLALAWAAYFVLHSAMAADRVKTAAYRAGIGQQTYRVIYSVIATVLLLALLFYNGILGGESLFRESTWTKYAGLILAGGGIFVFRAAFRQYSLSSFLGLKAEGGTEAFKRSGILRYVRHPIYSATILFTLGYLLFDPRLATLVSVLCIWAYLPVGIYFEEKKLIRAYGEAYRNYRKEVPAILPWPFS